MTATNGDRAKERIETVARLSRLVSSSLDVDRALAAVTVAVRESFDAPGVIFWTADDAARRLDLRLVAPEELTGGLNVNTMSYDQGVAGWVASQRRLLHVPDVGTDERVLSRAWWQAHGFVSALVVPVVAGEALLGVLSVIGRTAFTDEDAALAEALAAHAAGVLHNAAGFARSEARRQAAEALAEVSRLLSQTLDPETVGRRVTDSVCRLLDARSAAIYRIVADGSFEAVTVSSAAEFPWLRQLPASVGIAGLALRERQPVATSDLLDDPRLFYAEAFKEKVSQNPYRALLAVPLVAQGREFGVVAVGDRTGRHFSDDDMRLTQAFADQAAVALENARLYDEAERRRREAEELAQVASVINASLDATRVLPRVLEAARALTGANLSRLALRDPARDVMVFRFAEGTTYEHADIHRGKGLGGLAWVMGRAVRSDDRRVDGRVTTESLDLVGAADVRATIVVPIIIGGLVEGLLYVANTSPAPFDAHHEEVLQRLADQAAIAMHNARLFADEQASRASAQAAAQALRESEAVLQRAMEVGQIGSWTSSVEVDGPLEWSHEVFRIFGVNPVTFRGTKEDFLDRVHPDDLPPLAAARAHALATGETLSIDHRIVRPDGEVRWVHERADLQRDGMGQPFCFIGVVQDITDRKQAEEALKTAEEQLRQSQKMDAIGRLAGGVAHDFNNLLSIITGRSELVLRHQDLAALVRRDIELVHRTADRAASLTRQLLAFSRKQVLQPKVLDLNTVVATMGRMLRRVIGEDVDLVIVARPGVARVNADPGQLEQVILNLAVNARDAMPGGGRLTIETADVDLDEEHARRHPGVDPGRHVMLAVSDTGVGMDAAVRERIFEPFFTTKEVGKGTGLGLSTVYGIVQQSGGTVWVYSEPGRGTTFKIYLPSVSDSALEADQPPEPPRGGHETVLLCEDEADLRELTRDVLEEYGYRVISAGDGREALEVAAGFSERIDLLLTDVVMPRMNGSELAKALTRERGVRVLYMSGYTETALVRGDTAPGAGFLQKPFSPVVLARAVRERLDSAN